MTLRLVSHRTCSHTHSHANTPRSCQAASISSSHLSHILSQVSYSRGLPAKLAAAAAEADFKTVRRQAHSLKGSSGYIGAVQVRCRRRLLLAPDSPYLHRSYQPLFDAQVPVLSQTLVEISGAADPRAVTALIGELSAAIDTLRWEAKPFECCVSN